MAAKFLSGFLSKNLTLAASANSRPSLRGNPRVAVPRTEFELSAWAVSGSLIRVETGNDLDRSLAKAAEWPGRFSPVVASALWLVKRTGQSDGDKSPNDSIAKA